MTHHNEISPVITAGVWESDQMAFSTSSIRQWRSDEGNLKAWSPMKMNRPKPGVLGSQDWFAKGQRETRGQAEGSGGQGVEREARRQPQMSSGGKNVLPEVDSAFFSLSRSEIVFAQVLCGPAFFPPRASGTRKGGAKAKTTLPGELALRGLPRPDTRRRPERAGSSMPQGRHTKAGGGNSVTQVAISKPGWPAAACHVILMCSPSGLGEGWLRQNTPREAVGLALSTLDIGIPSVGAGGAQIPRMRILGHVL